MLGLPRSTAARFPIINSRPPTVFAVEEPEENGIKSGISTWGSQGFAPVEITPLKGGFNSLVQRVV